MSSTDQSSQPEKMSLESMSIADHQKAKLKELFPEVFTEGSKIDFEQLKRTLGEMVDSGKERFGMNWAGKGDCYKTIQQPSVATLVPVPEESIDFDTTENVFIEGDNLEVLKLLQKSYLGKVKMIYIDPPYNTGNDFIYPDNYSENLDTYLEYTGQIDGEGRKFSTNVDTDGRFHSKWMNMMYPRLFLAKNLLREDGVIFISIDEIELANLRKICDEIFGEENHIAEFVWQNKKGGGNDAKYIAVEHEYVLMYARNETKLHKLFEPYKPEYLKRYKESDEQGKFFWDTFKRKSGKQYYPIQCPDGSILELDENNNPISWLRSESRFLSDLECGDVKFVKYGDKWSVQFKQRLPIGKKPRSIFLEDSIWSSQGTTSKGGNEVLDIFGKDVFPNPKPTGLIKHILGFNVENGDIVLDFFAGSGTTAHAIFDYSILGKKVHFITVQLPEIIEPKTEQAINAISLGYKQITELTKERIRRVAAKIKAEIGTNTDLLTEEKVSLDLGFRVFKLQKSNFKVWDATLEKDATNIQLALEAHIDHIDPNATQQAILFELLLKAGFELTTPIDTLTLANKTVFSIAEGALLICLEKELTLDLIKAIADLEPSRVIVLDEGFQNNDQLKTNASLTLKAKGIVDFRTV